MVTQRHIDGVGAVFVDDKGGIVLVSDACVEAFDNALARGISADDIVNALLDEAEASRAAGATIEHIRQVHIEDARVIACRMTNGIANHSRRCNRHRRLVRYERWQKRHD